MSTESRSFWRALWRRRGASFGLGLLGAFALLAVFGPWLSPHDPTEFVTTPHRPPSAEFWLGSTGEGKDVLSQTLAGARISLLVGFGCGFAVTVLGAVIGVLAATLGGWLDEAVSLLINVFLMLPGLPLAVVFAAYLPQGPLALAFVLVVTGWAWNARVLRAQALSLCQRDFVLAARVTGESALGIVLRELLPNLGSLLFSTFISASLYAIGAQVGLEFLGLGDVSVVTWGTNLYWAANSGALLLSSWWTIVPTGLCIALVGLGLALINAAVDELANPALRASAGEEQGRPFVLLTPVSARAKAPGDG